MQINLTLMAATAVGKYVFFLFKPKQNKKTTNINEDEP